MDLFFTLEMFNNTNNILIFQDFISDYNYYYYVNKTKIKPKETFIITIRTITGLPIIASLVFNKGNLNILNQIQKHYGSSIFLFDSDKITSQILFKKRYQPNGNLPMFSFIKIEAMLK